MSVAELKVGDEITILVPAFNSKTGVQLADMTLPVAFVQFTGVMLEWIDRNNMKGWTPGHLRSGVASEGIRWCHGHDPDDVMAMKVAHSLAETAA